jgi:uncharacterized protein (TIGR02145 family)
MFAKGQPRGVAPTSKHHGKTFHQFNIKPLTRRITMRTQLTKITLAAGIALAITFTLSCSSSNDDPVLPVIPGSSDSGDPSGSSSSKQSNSGGGSSSSHGSSSSVSSSSTLVDAIDLGRINCISEKINDASYRSYTPSGIALECEIDLEAVCDESLHYNQVMFGECQKREVCGAKNEQIGFIENDCNETVPNFLNDHIEDYCNDIIPNFSTGGVENYCQEMISILNGKISTKSLLSKVPAAYSISAVEYCGEIYKTVVIGNQTWFARNLNCELGTDPSIGMRSRCYNDKPENCAEYGRLYNDTLANVVCPAGWHLPSKDDWKELLEYGFTEYGFTEERGEGYVFNKLMSASWDGTDICNFSALPSGHCAYRFTTANDDGCYRLGVDGASFAATFNGNESWHVFVNGNIADVGFHERGFGSTGYMRSVRCLKD